MARKNILHMITPLRQMSPFDVNMAIDAGFDVVVPYAGVEWAEVTGLVQDAIFSRPPDAGVNTGIFIGGRDVMLALDMLEAAREALVPPFTLSVLADPSGSFTTAAAMLAKVEKVLDAKFGRNLKGAHIVIFGATGVVGFCSAVIAAREGAKVTLAGYDGVKRVQTIADGIKARFDLDVTAADGSSDEAKRNLVADAEIVLSAAKAGIRVLSRAQLADASKLLVAADVNAVPPAGIEGLEVNAYAVEIPGTSAFGIGALAIGNVKYKTEFNLFKRMIEPQKTVTLDFQDAFALARTFAK